MIKETSIWRETFYKFIHNRVALGGMLVIIGLGIVAIFAPIIAPFNPTEINLLNRLQPPNLSHVFGTDSYGRDIFSRIVFGSRISLLVGFSSISIGVSFGASIGTISGYVGGKLDNVLMRILDSLYAFPAVLLAMAIIHIMGRGLLSIILAVAIPSIPGFARVIRSTVLSVRENMYVESSKALGGSSLWIIYNHIVPNSLSAVIVMGALRIGTAILVASSLSFLGLGIPPPTSEWGAMLSNSRAYIVRAPHLSIIPGLFIMLTVLAFNLTGDGLRDALDPKLKQSQKY